MGEWERYLDALTAHQIVYTTVTPVSKTPFTEAQIRDYLARHETKNWHHAGSVTVSGGHVLQLKYVISGAKDDFEEKYACEGSCATKFRTPWEAFITHRVSCGHNRKSFLPTGNSYVAYYVIECSEVWYSCERSACPYSEHTFEKVGPVGYLSPSDDSYFGSAGGSHNVNLILPTGYTFIYWYLKSPDESGYGTNISSVSGDGSSTTASYTYTFPADASGDYVLTAYAYLSDGTIVEPSYTVSVSGGSSASVPSVPLSLSVVSGNGSVDLSWSAPSSDGGSSILHYEYRYGTGSSVTPANYTPWVSMGSALSSYTVSGLTNDVLHTFEVQAVNSVGGSGPSSSSSATPTASTTTPAPAPAPTPPASVPVWSDIPDPYNLTVGDSFYLDLSSYVSGSPMITRNGGVTPAGLSFSNGILSGTVTTVETRGFRFRATNSVGSAVSEWINMIVTAAD